MFKRKKTENYQTQSGATRLVNRIITYGLVIFMVYAVYSSGGIKRKTPENIEALNYTPVNLGDYIWVKNLASGESRFYDLEGRSEFTLAVTAKDIAALNKNGSSLDDGAALYQIEVNALPAENKLVRISRYGQ